MEQIINKIIEVEKRAQEIMDEARKMKENLPSSIVKDTKELNENYMLRAMKRLEIVKENEQKFLEETEAELNAKKTADLEKLQQNFDANCDKWALSLYNRILGR